MQNKPDLHQLRILVALHDLRNVGQVARLLKMSQPGISAALNRLRQAFNDPLFIKTASGMQPTVRASRLVPPIRTALASIDSEVLSNIAFDPALTQRTFTLALSDIGELLFLPRLARHIRQLAPHATLQSVAPSLSGLEQGLERDDIDIVIGYRPDLKRKHYLQQKLLASDSVCLLRADHPIAGNRLSATQFLALEHILIRADNRAHEEWESFFAERRMHRKIGIHTPHLISVPLLIAQSDRVALLPRFVAEHIVQHHNNVKIMTLELDLAAVDVKQYWHRRFHHDAANKWLRSLIARIFQPTARADDAASVARSPNRT
jgi:DNA-binding transcriptional LysR family regulator